MINGRRLIKAGPEAFFRPILTVFQEPVIYLFVPEAFRIIRQERTRRGPEVNP
jgi:hypothetical protein